MFFKEIDKRRAKTYLFTIKPMNHQDDVFIAGARKLVRNINKGLAPRIGYRFQVTFTPSKPAKRFAWKYANKHSPRKIRLEDAETVDVYVHKRIYTKKLKDVKFRNDRTSSFGFKAVKS